MKKLFKLSLFIGVLALLLAGCAQVIDPQCFSGGVLGGGSDGYGGIEFFIEDPYDPPLTMIAGDWLYDGNDSDSERITFNSDGTFVLQSSFDDQNQINNGSYRYNDAELEFNIEGNHYTLDYSLAGENLSLKHKNGLFVYNLQSSKLK